MLYTVNNKSVGLVRYLQVFGVVTTGINEWGIQGDVSGLLCFYGSLLLCQECSVLSQCVTSLNKWSIQGDVFFYIIYIYNVGVQVVTICDGDTDGVTVVL